MYQVAGKHQYQVELTRQQIAHLTGLRVETVIRTMKELEAKLNPSLFQRVHRSTIVNIDCIQKICSHINGEYFLILDDEAKIKMSRSYRSKIKHII